jgi:hypothetical protein
LLAAKLFIPVANAPDTAPPGFVANPPAAVVAKLSGPVDDDAAAPKAGPGPDDTDPAARGPFPLTVRPKPGLVCTATPPTAPDTENPLGPVDTVRPLSEPAQASVGSRQPLTMIAYLIL